MKTLQWCVDKAGFSDTDQERFEVNGWIWNKNRKPIQLRLVSEKGEEIPCRIIHTKRADVLKYLNISDDNEKPGFSVSVDKITEVWTKAEQLKLYASCDQEEACILTQDLDKLKQEYGKNNIKYHIDSVQIMEPDRVAVRGWAFSKGEVCEFLLTDGDGKSLKFDRTRLTRRDVNQTFHVSDTLSSGFELVFSKELLKKNILVLKISHGEESVSYEILPKKLLFENSNFGKYCRLLGPKKAAHNVKYICRHGWKEFRKELAVQLDPGSQGYDYWIRQRMISSRELKQQRERKFVYNPKISIVIPLYNTPLNYFDELLDSIIGQSYQNWELCLADGSETTKIAEHLQKKYKQEKRLVYKKLKENRGISINTNEALRLATGDFIMLSDHDDVLEKDALYEIVKAINSKKHPDIIYTDEDKVTMDGKRYFDPHFKSDFNLDLLRSNNYICHIFVVAKKIVDQIGEFRSEYDGAQDYDFILRCCEKASYIYHIPKILYHWRSHPGSTAGNPASKMYAYENGKKAVAAHYQRVGIDAEVTMTPYWGRYRSVLAVKGEPKISIIIPNKDHVKDLDRCLTSIYEKSTYQNYEVIVVENNSTEEETFVYYEQIQHAHENLKVICWKDIFNYAAINNEAARQATGEYLIFLNNDVEVITENWMEEMLGYCQRDDVGIVGAKLYYPDDTVQHAGVILGLGAAHAAGHVFYGVPRAAFTYRGQTNSTQDLSAVTAACMMVKKSIHEKIGGFNQELQVAFNDVDYCLRVRKLGKLVVFQAFVELYHYESQSRGLEDTEEKKARFEKEAALFRNTWKKILDKGDPYYNPNLTLVDSDCSLKW